MGIIGAAFFPHPPIVLPEVGRGQEKSASATISGMTELAGLVSGLKPDVIAVVTPHGPAFSDVIALFGGTELTGTMEQFSAPQVTLTKRINRELLAAFAMEAEAAGLPLAPLDVSALARLKLKPVLDHGALVPLSFVERHYKDYTLLHISPGGPSLRKQFAAGQALQRAAAKTNLKVLVLASGDMSHKLLQSGPYGFDEAGPKFDSLVVDAIKRSEPGRILAIDPALANKAAQCGWKPAVFALGALDGSGIDCHFISYEGPFGVGYMTALMTPREKNAESRLSQLTRAEAGRAAAVRQGEDGYVCLARETIERFVRSGAELTWADLKPDVSELDALRMERRKAGAFVSLHMEGELRGCMGTIVPVCAHVGEEIIRNAIMACSQDPRFSAVEQDELRSLEVKVDVLSPFESISSPDELDPQRYGVIVEKGSRRGLLLPKLEGVDSVRQQLDIACRKAGFQWKDDDGIKLFRFTVERHGKED
jgi:MEMO1 family protein